MEPSHRTADDGEPQRSLGQRAVRNLGLLIGGIVLVVGVGLFSGWLYAKGSPQRAAATVVGQFVVDEPSIGDRPPPSGVVAPTSGTYTGTPRCGRVDSVVSVDDQLATIATGAVIVQYRPADVTDDVLLNELARRPDVLVAPNAALDRPVVATAWTQRMPLPAATPELLFAFVTAHRGVGPDARETCPVVSDPAGS